jgi:uncharacterized protein involved in exopolysaccharide biosynthesis
MMKTAHQEKGLRDLLTLLFKHKAKIVAMFFLSVFTGLFLSFLLPPVYEAKTNLLVKIGREYVSRPDLGEGRTLMSLEQQEVINSEIQILSNRELIEKVINRLTVEYLYPDLVKHPSKKMTPLGSAILKFEKSLKVDAVRKSNVIQVAYQHKDPKVALKALNLLIDLFKEKHLEVFSETPSSFLESQMAVYREKLKDSENRMESFKQENQVVSLDEQKSLLLKQRTDLDSSLKQANNTIRELQEKLASLNSQKNAASANKALYTDTEREKIIVDAKAKLLTLQLQEQDLLKKYTEESRLVVNVRKEIQFVQNFLKEQEEDISARVGTGNRVYQEMELERIKTNADLKSQQAKAATLAIQISRLDEEIRSLDSSGIPFENLKRELSTNAKYYQTYVDRLEEARISENMNLNKLANISVIQEAAVPEKPVRPRKSLNLLISIFIGGVSGIGLALFSEGISQSFTTPESAERRLALPVLTVISYKKE